jgi:6-pyruvoyltetrahydropterin/6-carboxytetrahydropterin synthase
MMRIYKEFWFEAAHYLPSAPPGHPNARIHGHSFHVRVCVAGEPDEQTGLIFHFDDLEAATDKVKQRLDHHFLNDIAGLETPTLERLCRWLWNELEPLVPGLAEIHLSRPSCGEGCIYAPRAATTSRTSS